ncbi:MAG: sulfatase-like hydrolase/transferase [Bryobacteraceae bacterium]|nr:sulfatase-like hydrolase/transferase [Bryobacteraceae bacterium]
MNRRSFLVVLGGAAAASAQAAGKPNLVLILADDLGYGDLGCYGNARTRTPAIDSLAAGGVRFTDFHSNGAVCSPTRAALMTGRYQQRSGVDEVINATTMRDGGLPLAEVTVAEMLRDAGYTTAMFGKWHLGYDPKFHPGQQGFSEFRGYVSGNVDYFSHVDQAGFADWWHNGKPAPEDGYTTELITRHALDFIERNQTKPFFLYLAHESVHSPYQGPNDKAMRTAGQKDAAPPEKADVSGTYTAMIEAMDDGIGRVLAKVKALPRDRETFVFFCSDNGATNKGSNGKLRGFKAQLWEGGHRVPAVAYWPGRIPAGGTSGVTALTMDLFPTLLDAAGVKAPKQRSLDGVTLLPSLRHATPLAERALFWAHGPQRAVRWKQWKLTRMPNQAAWLSDLSGDPSESKNLAAEQPAIVADLTARLERWERSVAPGHKP